MAVRTAFLFPGQGSQYVGMGNALFLESAVARQIFEEANDVLGFDVAKLCFKGDLTELTDTYNAQPAILTVSMAAFRTLMAETPIKPFILAGHSLGEISALVASGAIRFQDGLRLVRRRGYLMREASISAPGSMAAISGMPLEMIEKKCAEYSNHDQILVLSNINSPDQIVISGDTRMVTKACELLTEEGAYATLLNVSAAFHSPLMKQASCEFAAELNRIQFSELKWPVLSNVTALPYRSYHDIADYLTRQMVSTVMWSKSMQYLKYNQVEAAIEMEPRNVLRNLMKWNEPQIKTYSYKGVESMDLMEELLNAWKTTEPEATTSTHSLVERCLAIAICTRNRNWSEGEYRLGVVEPYRQVKLMQDKIESENRQPAYDEMVQAIQMLKSVFVTKKAPIDEQTERLQQLFRESGTSAMFSTEAILHKGLFQ
ncbi:ACP S-malonyltransferase [Paenibacillus donghaensis]|nr:ACP S-malonyltransferase [Paenibacillus donghaensis]